jgi:YVTN family beta-propeller protein
MLALYRAGRQAEALEAYREARTAFVEELGLEPSPALQQLERDILTHDPKLAAPAPRVRKARSRPPAWLPAVTVGAVLAVGGVLAYLATRGDTPAATVSAGPNAVAIIDPGTNQLSAAIPVGTHPVGIAYRGGDVWVANTDDGTLSRIDPRTHEVKTIGVGTTVTDVALPTREAVWVGNGSAGTLSLVSPVLRAPVGTVDLRGPDALVPRPVYALDSGAGSLWAAAGGRRVVRVDPRTRKVIRRIPVSATALAITYDSGAVWVVTGLEQLVRIDARTGKKTGEFLVGYPRVASAGYGSVWVGLNLYAPSGALAQVDANSLQLESRTPIIDPVAIAVGRTAVWVASGSNKAVYRIDPDSGKVAAVVHVGGAPAGVALVDGSVWVTLDRPA